MNVGYSRNKTILVDIIRNHNTRVLHQLTDVAGLTTRSRTHIQNTFIGLTNERRVGKHTLGSNAKTGRNEAADCNM